MPTNPYMVEYIQCPLCGWTYEVKALDPRINNATLAGVFGYGVYKATALDQHVTKIDAALAEHFNGHTVVEWVTKVRELQQENERLREDL